MKEKKKKRGSIVQVTQKAKDIAMHVYSSSLSLSPKTGRVGASLRAASHIKGLRPTPLGPSPPQMFPAAGGDRGTGQEASETEPADVRSNKEGKISFKLAEKCYSIGRIRTAGTRNGRGDGRPRGVAGNGRKVVGGSKQGTSAVTQAGIDGSILVDHQPALVVRLVRNGGHVAVTVVTITGIVVRSLPVTSLTVADAVARVISFVEVAVEEMPAPNITRRRRSVVLCTVRARVI